MNQAGRRRGLQSLLVDPYKQVKIGLLFIILNILFSAGIFGVFGYYMMDVFDTVSTYFKMSSQEELFTLAKYRLPIGVGALLVITFVVTTLVVSIRYTHTIYGPLVSIHRFLDELLNGEQPRPIKLRSADELQDLAEKLNTLGGRLASDRRGGAATAVSKFLDQMISGEKPEPLKIREGDPYQEVAKKLNQLLERKFG